MADAGQEPEEKREQNEDGPGPNVALTSLEQILPAVVLDMLVLVVRR